MKFIWFLIYSFLFYRLVKIIVNIVRQIMIKRNINNSESRKVEDADFEIVDDDESEKKE